MLQRKMDPVIRKSEGIHQNLSFKVLFNDSTPLYNIDSWSLNIFHIKGETSNRVQNEVS